MRLLALAAGVAAIVGALGTPAAITGIGATMTVWDAHHTPDVHCPKASQSRYACRIGYDRNPSLPAQVCPNHDEFCSLQVPDSEGIVWGYGMQFPSGTDLARAEQLVLTQLPAGARIAWYQSLTKQADQRGPAPSVLGVCSEMGLTSRTLADRLPIKGEGGVLVTLWWDSGKAKHVNGATLTLWGSHATPQPDCGAYAR